MGICGIILSGGMSRRFQVPGEPWIDKAMYPIGGKPMIRIIYDTLLEVADKIIVSTGTPERVEKYRGVLGEAIYTPDVEGFRGPLAGILASLRICEDEYAIAVPVDMPYIESELLRKLLAKLGVWDVASPILPNGLVETAVIGMRKSVARRVLEVLKGYGRSRVADLHRGSPNIYLLNMKRHGFDPNAIMNINRRDDIGRRVKYPEGPVEDDIDIMRGFLTDDIEDPKNERLRGSLWWTLARGDPYEEVKLYLGKGIYMLAAYALEDSKNIFDRYIGSILQDIIFKDIA
jgi:molybdopterin-guanine dinucleotide biosynthesis protein A